MVLHWRISQPQNPGGEIRQVNYKKNSSQRICGIFFSNSRLPFSNITMYFNKDIVMRSYRCRQMGDFRWL